MLRLASLSLALAGCSVSDDAPAPESDLPAIDTDGEARCAGGQPRGLRRLTRYQFDRVASDLLGEEVALGSGLPAEASAWEGGFEAQAVSPALVDGWWRAAEELADRVAWSRRVVREVEDADPQVGRATELPGSPAVWWELSGAGTTLELPLELGVATAGRYRLSVRAVWSTGFASETFAPRLSWRLDGRDVRVGDVVAEHDAPGDLSVEVMLPASVPAVLRVEVGAFSAVAIDRVVLEGPFDDAPPRSGRWLTCMPDGTDVDGCIRTVLTAFADRAWRRAPTSDEVDVLTDLVGLALDEGEDVRVGLALALRAVLVSPWFLFVADGPVASGEARAASPAELADRLALTLWGSLPDATLRACVDEGTLTVEGAGPCGLDAQVGRMLLDPRASALVRDFGRQWLGVDVASALTRDPVRYPTFDAALRTSIVDGVYGTLDEARAMDLDLRRLLDASWTWGDERLATLYGVSPPVRPGKLSLPSDRVGLLGSAFYLAVTSHADRTSPVLRGRWILDRLLCTPPGSPPDGVPALSEDAASGDVRAELAAHRADPACAYCHDRIDPYGLPAEGFDALGAARATYPDGAPIDTTAVLPDETEVADLAALSRALAVDPAVEACLVRHAATWTWGRAPTTSDADTLAAAREAALARGFSLDAIIAALVVQDPMTCTSGSEER